MYNVILKNEYGEEIDLMHSKDMMCIDIDGATSVTATLNETENANIDGSIINSERIDSRPIDLTVRIFGNYGECRTKLYQYAVIKRGVKLTLVNDVRSVSIEGQVKSIDCDPYDKKEQMVITILCPEPFFSEAISIITEFSNIKNMFYFEFAIEEDGIPIGEITDVIQAEVINAGEVDNGLEFVLKAEDTVVNPKIINIDTNEFMGLKYTMKPNESILIGTINKKKYVISLYQNVKTNIINAFDLNSTWLNAKVGTNNYTYTADSGDNHIEASVEFRNKYLGV